MEPIKNLLAHLQQGNCYHEHVTLVAATKTRTADEINLAIEAGIRDIGENKVQEFCEKYELVSGANRHFIGHLQTNKVKYLIGKTYLIHSVDRDELAAEIAKRSVRAKLVTDILVQINIGNEETKGGYLLEEGFAAFQRLSRTEGLRVCGFMAML
ncbi:MAG: alanine racemase, partial [Clostridiales bacterium]|nr:alanine racemase [Clostridiales bacterium]